MRKNKSGVKSVKVKFNTWAKLMKIRIREGLNSIDEVIKRLLKR